MKQSSLAIVGLSTLFREGFQLLLRRSRFSVLIKAATLDEALTSFPTSRPELLVYAMAGANDAAACIEQLRANRTQLDGTRVVLLTDQLSAEQLRDAAASGVQGILSQNVTNDVLHRSLDLVILGQQFFPSPAEEAPARPAAALIPFSRPVLATATTTVNEPPNTSAPVQNLFGPTTAGTGPQRGMALSDRERQILRCLVNGAANKTIARDLHITEATVKVHIKGLLRKISVTNRTQAAVWGLSNLTLLNEHAVATRDHSREFHPARHAAS